MAKDIEFNPYASAVSIDGRQPKPSCTGRPRLLWAGLTVALFSNVGAVAVMLTLLSIEPGVAIRPMRHTAMAFMFAELGLLAGVPMCLIGRLVVVGRRRSAATFGIVLNLAPLPLSSLTLRLVANYVGLTLKP